MGKRKKTAEPAPPPEPRLLSIAVPVGFQHWAHIYEPISVRPDTPFLPRFTMRLPFEAFPEDMQPDLRVKEGADLSQGVHSSSKTRVEVVPPSWWGDDALVATLARLEARNLRRDEIFVGRELIVDLEAQRFKDLLPPPRFISWPPNRWVLRLLKVRIQ